VASSALKYRYISMKEVAGLAGIDWNDRNERDKMMRMLKRKNIECGGKLIVSGGNRNHKRYTTIALLRAYCADMFDVQTEVAIAVADKFDDHSEKISELNQKIKLLALKFREFSVNHTSCLNKI